MSEFIVVLSDMQIPYHNRRAAKRFLDFVETFKPDMILSVGDEVDFPQVSRWSRGMEGEYKNTLQAHIDEALAFFRDLRDVYRGPIHVSRSNHMDRPLKYVAKYAPGLMGLEALTVPSLLQFDDLEIHYHEKPYEFVPGWLLAHGDEKPLHKGAGMTAYKAATEHYGKSVVCGHTHRQGVLTKTYSHGGKVVRRLTGFEVGHLMDTSKADYLGGGAGDWQAGFGVLYVNGRKVQPVPVPVEPNGSFSVEGLPF